MKLTLHHAHAWDITPREAVALQRELADLVRLEPMTRTPATVAGVDVSVRAGWSQAAVIVLDYATLQVVDKAIWREPVRFPYVSGLLSFREIPAVLFALDQLERMPDLIIADAQGVAHPRRVGLAAHLGVLLEMPTIGAAKSRLVGEAEEPDLEAGAQTPLLHKGEQIGTLLRTRTNVKPMYISPGYGVTHAQAVSMVQHCVTRYRMPEPTRLAHWLSREASDE